MERDLKIDILKGITIYMVVIGHVIAWQFEDFSININTIPDNTLLSWKFIYSFHMPLFMFLSGYVFLNPQKEYKFSHIIRRCITYMIPFITMGVILYSWRGGNIDNYWYFRSLSEFTLILFTIISVIKYFKVNKIIIYPISYLIFVLLLYYINKALECNNLLSNAVDNTHLMLGIYWSMGWIYRTYKCFFDKIFINSAVMFISMLFVFVCFVYKIHIAYIHQIMTIILFLNISNILINKFNCNHLEEVGKDTMGIYIFHFFFTFKIFAIGHFLCEIANQGVSTNIIVQLSFALPTSYIIIKCCKYLIKFMKQNPIMSLLCFGDLNIFKEYHK